MTRENAQRLARVVRAKAAELENRFLAAEAGDKVDLAYLVADVALIASVLADLLDEETQR